MNSNTVELRINYFQSAKPELEHGTIQWLALT